MQERDMDANSDLSLLGENFEMGRVLKDDDSGSDNFDAGSGDDHDANEDTPRRRRKKYHRHTPQQIQELEARTQMKTQLERHENMMLRQENEKLRAENTMMKESMANPMCKTCGGQAIPGQISFEDHQVRIENARLKDELNRICALAQKFLGRSVSSMVAPLGHHLQQQNSGMELAGMGIMNNNGFGAPSNVGMPQMPMGLDLGMGNGGFGAPPLPAMPLIKQSLALMGSPSENTMLLQLGLTAMEELVKLSQPDNPLWIKSSDGRREVLDLEEYGKVVSPCMGPRPNGYVTEATRESGLVLANCLSVVETLMNADQWSEIFPALVARSLTLPVMPGDTSGTKDGELQVVHAEVHLPSPLVPVRQMTFLRFCKEISEGTWAVVDTSVDIGQSIFSASAAHPFMGSRRLPSGCIVRDTSSEHNQYDESAVHQLYRPLVSSGIGFGAQKWVASLQRHYEYVASLNSPSLTPEDPAGLSLAGKRGMLKITQQITNSFFSGVCPSAAHQWEPLQFEALDDSMKIMARKTVTGEPDGIVLSAATSVWLPVPQQNLFDYLSDERSRTDWDVMANNGPIQELFHIPKGQGHGNNISVLRPSANGADSNVLILQDAFTDNTSSVIVYVAMDMDSLNTVMSGGETTLVGVLPSGFVIHPDGRGGGSSSSNSSAGDGGGSFLTVGLQILLNSLSNANMLSMDSVFSVNNLIADTVQKIKVALGVA
ncbi:hypothetical protein RIF29_13339 [Crotalaria pallida]|uniref:START domain-containing protein n=1 Tax=Crotalaria pallida TaxID=3830 RepID=A0AAN9IP44_CROPI